MEKCVVCGGKKAFRECPGSGGKICSACCGKKRQNEIKCPDSCEILKSSNDHRLMREVMTEITDEIGRTFRTEADDVFKKPVVAKFAADLESAFLDNFYDDESFTDNDIRMALVDIYSRRTGREIARHGGPAEALVLAIWKRADQNHPELSDGLKTRTLLRILKSIRDSSGGILGERGYLEMLHDQFSGSGPFAADDEGESDEDEECGPDETDEQEYHNGSQEKAEEDMGELKATTTGQLMGNLLRMAMAEDPDGVRTARRIFRKEFGWLEEHIGTDWSDPVMANEFIIWFCTGYDFISGETPVEAFRHDYWAKLDEKTRILANTLHNSVGSTFQVTNRDGKDYRLVDCRTEHEYLVRTVDLTDPIEVGSVIYARIIWNTGPADGSYHFQGLVLPLAKDAAKDTRLEAGNLKEAAARCRDAFLKRFGRLDPTFKNGEEAYEALADFRDAFMKKTKGGKRRKRAEELPAKGELWEMTVGPWEHLVDEKGPVALMFESDGLHASRVYPGLLRALDGAEKDEKAALETLRRSIEGDDEIPLTSLRRLLTEHKERSVRILSGVYPDIGDFDGLRSLVERRRAEPFDLEPAVDLSLCMPPDAPGFMDDDLFEVKATPMGDDKPSRDILYHIRTGKCPYSKSRCLPAECKYGKDGIDRCPVHSGEKV